MLKLRLRDPFIGLITILESLRAFFLLFELLLLFFYAPKLFLARGGRDRIKFDVEFIHQ